MFYSMSSQSDSLAFSCGSSNSVSTYFTQSISHLFPVTSAVKLWSGKKDHRLMQWEHPKPLATLVPLSGTRISSEIQASSSVSLYPALKIVPCYTPQTPATGFSKVGTGPTVSRLLQVLDEVNHETSLFNQYKTKVIKETIFHRKFFLLLKYKIYPL